MTALAIRKDSPVTGEVKRVYICGPMTGYENHNFPLFDLAKDALVTLGYRVVSPPDIARLLFNGVTTLPPQNYLREDIVGLLKCDAICLLPGWEKSTGAKMEIAIGITLRYEFLFFSPDDGQVRAFDTPESVVITDGYRNDPRLA